MRVVVAEDALFTRVGLCQLLREMGHEVVAETADADVLLAAVREHRPDLVITDIKMPPRMADDGLAAARLIREELPEVKVLVLSQYVESNYALAILNDDRGGSGYLLKDSVFGPMVLSEAIARLSRGETVIEPEIIEQLMRRRRTRDPVAELSERERAVLALVAEGHSNSAIAGLLYISERTVEAHAATIFTKLGLHQSPDVHRRVQAVVAFLRSGSA